MIQESRRMMEKIGGPDQPEEYKAQSLIPGSRTITDAPQAGQRYSYYTIKDTCVECKKAHNRHLQKGLFMALHAGVFVEVGSVTWVKLIAMREDEASHICGNSWCADPFHVMPESEGTNKSREACHRGWKDITKCQHRPKCLKKGPSKLRTEHWEEVMMACNDVKEGNVVERPFLQCSQRDVVDTRLVCILAYSTGTGSEEGYTCKKGESQG